MAVSVGDTIPDIEVEVLDDEGGGIERTSCAAVLDRL